MCLLLIGKKKSSNQLRGLFLIFNHIYYPIILFLKAVVVSRTFGRSFGPIFAFFPISFNAPLNGSSSCSSFAQSALVLYEFKSSYIYSNAWQCALISM